jgi:hypothetical protein
VRVQDSVKVAEVDSLPTGTTGSKPSPLPARTERSCRGSATIRIFRFAASSPAAIAGEFRFAPEVSPFARELLRRARRGVGVAESGSRGVARRFARGSAGATRNATRGSRKSARESGRGSRRLPAAGWWRQLSPLTVEADRSGKLRPPLPSSRTSPHPLEIRRSVLNRIEARTTTLPPTRSRSMSHRGRRRPPESLTQTPPLKFQPSGDDHHPPTRSSSSPRWGRQQPPPGPHRAAAPRHVFRHWTSIVLLGLAPCTVRALPPARPHPPPPRSLSRGEACEANLLPPREFPPSVVTAPLYLQDRGAPP